MTKNYRVADYIADYFLKNKITKHIFLLPGGGNMHLVDAFGKCKGIDVVACLHEQAVSIAAEAYSRISEKIGVALVTTGPGSTNAITGVVGAWIESVPLIIISGQVKISDMINNTPVRQKGVQEVDIVNMIKKITKYSITVKKSDNIESILKEALKKARSGRAGPVWIDVPLDIQGAPIKLYKKDIRKNKSSDKTMKENYITNIQNLLANSKRPILLAGHGVRLSGAAQSFKKLVDTLGIPALMTWNAMDLLPYNHKLNIGRPGVVALRAPNFAIQNSDLVISIGSRLDNIITAFNPKKFAPHAKKIIVDIDQNEINNLDMKIEMSVNCNAKNFINSLIKNLDIANFNWKEWQDKCKHWKKEFSIEKEKSFSKKGEINHYHFTNILSEILPNNIVVSTGSSGLGIEAFYTAFKNKKGQRIFLTSGLGAMGYGLPSSIGACFANNKKPMILVEGDGSFQLNIQEMSTLSSFNLPICLIIMNNKGYASIRNTQKNYFDSRFVGTGPEANLMLPDLKKIAHSYNVPYIKISKASEIKQKMNKAMKLKWPILIDVHLVSNEVLIPKVSAIPNADGSIISMPLEDMSPLLSIETLKKEMIIEISKASYEARKNKK